MERRRRKQKISTEKQRWETLGPSRSVCIPQQYTYITQYNFILGIPIFDRALETNSSFKMKLSLEKNNKSLQATTPLFLQRRSSSIIFLAKQISFTTTQMKNVTTSPEALCCDADSSLSRTLANPPNTSITSSCGSTFLIHYLSHSLSPGRTAHLAAAKTDSLLSHQLPTQLFSPEQH